MHRTQIYIPEELKVEVKNLAKKEGFSMGRMIRHILTIAVEKKDNYTAEGNVKDVMKLRELKLRGGPKDLSARFDEYLYGK